MPLSEPAQRQKIHTRTIVIDGYRRSDGMFDVEAHITDTKTRGFENEYRGHIAPGEPLHGMWMRMTIDDTMLIHSCEAASDHTPYAVCVLAAPNFARLAGLRIKPGFLREAAARIGGTAGCTHLRELLQQMGTTAHQTINSARAEREAAAVLAETGRALTPEEMETRSAARFGGATGIVNSCIAFDDQGPVVQRRWPHLYRGTGTEPGKAAAD